MTESGYYPPGAEHDIKAPYNQEDLPEKEVEVTISVTLSRTVYVMVKDYQIYIDADEDGIYPTYDFSECDLHKAVNEQIVLPQNLSPCKDWNVDEFEIIRE